VPYCQPWELQLKRRNSLFILRFRLWLVVDGDESWRFRVVIAILSPPEVRGNCQLESEASQILHRLQLDSASVKLSGLLLDKVELLELAIDDGCSVQTQPAVQDGGIGAAKIIIGPEVTIQLVFCLQRGIFGVHATLHRSADDDSHTASAAVGAGAVVPDAAAKLGEHEDHGFVLPAVLLEVSVEVPHGSAHLLPQLGMGR